MLAHITASKSVWRGQAQVGEQKLPFGALRSLQHKSVRVGLQFPEYLSAAVLWQLQNGYLNPSLDYFSNVASEDIGLGQPFALSAVLQARNRGRELTQQLPLSLEAEQELVSLNLGVATLLGKCPRSRLVPHALSLGILRASQTWTEEKHQQLSLTTRLATLRQLLRPGDMSLAWVKEVGAAYIDCVAHQQVFGWRTFNKNVWACIPESKIKQAAFALSKLPGSSPRQLFLLAALASRLPTATNPVQLPQFTPTQIQAEWDKLSGLKVPAWAFDKHTGARGKNGKKLGYPSFFAALEKADGPPRLVFPEWDNQIRAEDLKERLAYESKLGQAGSSKGAKVLARLKANFRKGVKRKLGIPGSIVAPPPPAKTVRSPLPRPWPVFQVTTAAWKKYVMLNQPANRVWKGPYNLNKPGEKARFEANFTNYIQMKRLEEEWKCGFSTVLEPRREEDGKEIYISWPYLGKVFPIPTQVRTTKLNPEGVPVLQPPDLVHLQQVPVESITEQEAVRFVSHMILRFVFGIGDCAVRNVVVHRASGLVIGVDCEENRKPPHPERPIKSILWKRFSNDEAPVFQAVFRKIPKVPVAPWLKTEEQTRAIFVNRFLSA